MWSVGFEPTKAVSKTAPRPAIKTEVFQFPHDHVFTIQIFTSHVNDILRRFCYNISFQDHNEQIDHNVVH